MTRPPLQAQAAAVREAIDSLALIWGRHGGPDEAERRLAPLRAAAETLDWLERHHGTMRALAADAQRIHANPAVAELLARFGGEVTEVREIEP